MRYRRNVSVRITPDLESRLTERSDTLGEVMRRDLARYYAIIAAETPTLQFTREEWLALADVLNGMYYDHDPTAIQLLWASVADNKAALEARWGINADALSEALRSASLAQRYAMVDVIERFWRTGEPPEVIARGVPARSS